METLYEPLAAILNEASFEMEYGKGDGAGRCVSPAELRAAYSRPEEQAIDRRARLLAPPALLTRLVDALRLALEPVIDPDTDEVGHAFSIEPLVKLVGIATRCGTWGFGERCFPGLPIRRLVFIRTGVKREPGTGGCNVFSTEGRGTSAAA